jgi:hypothetical protein
VLVIYAVQIFLLGLSRGVQFARSLGLIGPLALEGRGSGFACEGILVRRGVRVGVRAVKLGCGLRRERALRVLVKRVLRVLGFELELVVH